MTVDPLSSPGFLVCAMRWVVVGGAVMISLAQVVPVYSFRSQYGVWHTVSIGTMYMDNSFVCYITVVILR